MKHIIQTAIKQTQIKCHHPSSPLLQQYIERQQKMLSQRSKKQNLYLIPETPVYKQSQQPLLSQQKKASIEQKLKLEKQAIMHTRDREANLDFYLKYNYNPFLQYKGQDSLFVKELLRRGKGDVVNLAVKLGDMRMQQPVFKEAVQGKSVNLKDMKNEFQRFSNKILNNVAKQQAQIGQKQKIEQGHRHIRGAQKQKQQPVQQQFVPKQPTQQHLSRYEIDSIAAIREQNFFIKHYKKPNIFKVAKGQDDDLSSRQILKKYYFCLNSMVQKISKLKLPIYRDLSTMGRKVVTGQQTGKQNIVDYVDSYELSFKLKQLLFHDILSVASNRFSADFLNKMLNFQDSGNKQMSDTSSEEKEELAVIYRQNQKNKQHNFINENEEQQQIKDYKMLKNNDVEKKYERKYQRQRDYIQNKLELRKNLRGNTVKDQKLHEKLQQDVQNAFSVFLKLDQPRVDADRLVRYNKTLKNKTEVTKTKLLLQTIAYRNNQDQIMEMNKSKSKTKQKKK